MTRQRMTAAWWWIDRWRKSTAYTDMTAEEQGLYRNLLDEVWLREDHTIPNDPRILARVSGDAEAWKRCGTRVLRWMTRTGEGWTHETALEVIGQSQRRALNQRNYRERKRNVDHVSDNATDNGADNKADSPSPSPSPSPVGSSSTLVGRTIRPALPPSDTGPRSNPLVKDRRVPLERECLALVARMEALTREDPLVILARASGYTGAATTKLNPATMSDDRLANTVLDLRADVAAEEAKRKAVPRGA